MGGGRVGPVGGQNPVANGANSEKMMEFLEVHVYLLYASSR